jgi:hypothetical protein
MRLVGGELTSGPPQPLQQQLPVAWVLEEEPDTRDPYYTGDSARRAYRSAVFTLSLGVLGRSVGPWPAARGRPAAAVPDSSTNTL